jgi:hypothetical protein
MLAHPLHQAPPQLLATFFVDRFIADHGEFVRARRDENQNGIMLWCFVHPESMKLFLRGNQWIDIQFAALNENANLAGSL